MSERDCGKWYCQNAAGHSRMELNVDVKLDHSHCGDSDVKCLDEQRAGVPMWFDQERMGGWQGWLGAEQHGDGKAHHYWIWDVDSRGKYFEYTKFWNPGDVPGDYGDLHKGRAWQLPMLGVFYYEPGTHELAPLKRNRIPYVVMTRVDPPDDGDDDCECDNSAVLETLGKVIDLLEDLENELL